ncbi:PTS system, cellobiose-specific IIB component [Spiroplasma sp. NBRC 100390]|uniref:PTS sugar transporter subunit IIB n=1 Tax=unclassified Spiroplasma TaxID=2637901 RepID=UPI000892968D|nr:MULTISPECIES: PTS sugar transporter subunit IIB [unclassified Spiroplasma]AOX43414.1 PTS system, cellobiose-specific IIB component [Spiroplasma sp. TU-14]APE12884.1 PTS system, cellobiose-specific IIB component [Spiroplasma sp. NBRC 100390]
MKKILLVCSAGMSTSILVKKMKEAAENMDIDVEIEAKAMAEAQSVLEDWDVILLGPQVKYIENNIKSMTKKPVSVIDPKIYALGKGKEALELALKL